MANTFTRGNYPRLNRCDPSQLWSSKPYEHIHLMACPSILGVLPTLVSVVTFLSELSITDQPVVGLVVNGALGTVMMAWKKNKVHAASVTISKGLRHLLEKQLENIDSDVNRVHSKLWSKLPQRQEDERLAAAARTGLEQGAAQEVVQKGSRDRNQVII